MAGSYELKKKKGSAIFFFTISLFIGGYMFFFSSTLWMPAGSAASLLTPIGEDTSWEERTFQIIRWDYCEKTRVMEVEMDVHNNSYDGINTYAYSAVDRNSDKLTVEKIIEEPDWIILQIKGISERFSEMSLRVGMDREGSEADMLKLYTNVNAVNKVESITKQDRNGYRTLRFETQMAAYEKEIDKKEKQISQLTKQMEQMQGEIERLQSDLDYQTEEQKEETDTQIKEIEGNKTSSSEEIEKLQQEIRELTDRISLIKKQMAEVTTEEKEKS